MKKKFQHKQSKQKKSFAIYYVALFISVISLLSFALHIVLMQPLHLHTLKQLPVPKKPTVYLPGPLELHPPSSKVLGDETIDPNDVILYINNERVLKGAPPLRTNPILMVAAQKRAAVIMKHQNFSHQDPYEHIQLDTVLPLLHYPFIYASENIGMGDFTAKAFVFGFMHSTAHRENLLNPKLQETGVALATGPYKQYYVNIVVQLFAVPTTSDQYLGYSYEDIQQYQKLLEDVESQIRETRRVVYHTASEKEYYEGWQKILIRQKIILATLKEAMIHEQPFYDSFTSLIKEYNANWRLVPKS